MTATYSCYKSPCFFRCCSILCQRFGFSSSRRRIRWQSWGTLVCHFSFKHRKGRRWNVHWFSINLRRCLLYLACCHHVKVLLVSAAFSIGLTPALALEIQLLKWGKLHWKLVKQTDHDHFMSDANTYKLFDEDVDSLVDFFINALQKGLTLDDVGTHQHHPWWSALRGTLFQAPGVMLYALKAWMSRRQFQLATK